jgi:hypothetical protein
MSTMAGMVVAHRGHDPVQTFELGSAAHQPRALHPAHVLRMLRSVK